VQVPVRDYEDLKPYVDKVVAGQENILWKGKPLYFAKTSGTTSGQNTFHNKGIDALSFKRLETLFCFISRNKC
jgi:hypothetical protein